jgi:outer membrane autotransporter protein
MPRIASGFASEGRRLRSILAAPLLLAFALFAPTERATAQTIAFPSTDNDQLALAGNPVPNPLRASNDNEVTDTLLWRIVSDGTNGAQLVGAGNIDGATDGSKWAVNLGAGAVGGPNLTLGSQEGTVLIQVCRAFKGAPRGNGAKADFACDSTPNEFRAATVIFDMSSDSQTRVDRNELIFVSIDTYVGGSSKAAFVPLEFSTSGPVVDFFAKGNNFVQFRVDPAAPDNAFISFLPRVQANAAAQGQITFQVSEYLLLQTSPTDGIQAEAGSTITLTVEATRNGDAPDDELASRTVEWEVLGTIPPGTSLTGGTLFATSETNGTTATIELTIGAPNLVDEPIIVRAKAFPDLGQNRGPLPPPLNERTIEFIIDGVDVLEVNAEAGDGQSAAVGDPLADLLEVEVFRNGNPDAGRQIEWSVSPANAVTFAGGGSVATTSTDSGGASSVAVTSVNAGGTITVTATHGDDPTVSDNFTITGIATTLGLDTPTGDNQSTSINTSFPQSLGIRATRNGTAEPTALIDWSVSPAGAATLGSAQTTTITDGSTSNTVTAGAVGQTFSVIAARNDDPSIRYTYTLTAVDRRLSKPLSGSGDGQVGEPGQTLPAPLVVLATNNTTPAGDIPITWNVSGDATLDANQTMTGADGRSSVNVTFGPTTGSVTVVASRDDAPGTTTSFVLTSSRNNDVLTIEKPANSGDGSSGAPGTTVDLTALTLRNDEADPGVTVNWSVLAGQGRISQFTTTSNGSGIARNTFTHPDFEGTTRIRAARADRPQTSVVYSITTTVAQGDALVIAEGNSQSGDPGTRGTPLGVRFTRDGVNVPGTAIAWSVTSGAATLDGSQSSTGADGIARMGFVFGAQPGPISVRAAAGDLQVNFSLTVNDNGSGPSIGLRLVGGAGQSGAIGTRADQAIIVEVSDSNGDPVPDRRVDWQVISGSATLDFPSLITDANGRALQAFTFGPSAGPILIQASIFQGIGGTVDIPATSFVPTLTLVSGNDQSAPVSTVLPQDFVVAISAPATRAKSLAGVTIRWSVTQGGGSIAAATSVTDANGQSLNRLTLGPNAGLNQVTASVDGGGNVTFSATGTTTNGPLSIVSGNNQTLPTATDSAPLVVELRSATGQPVAGASIDWSASNASLVGNVVTTVTDAQGRSSNRARVELPGAASVVAQVRGSSTNRVTFVIDAGVANTPQLDQPQETVAEAIDNLCPALASATNLTPEAQDLLARCRELANNAGDNPDQVQDALDQYEQDVSIALADAALGGLNAQFDNVRQRIGQLRSGRKGVDLSGLGVASSTGLMPLSFLPSIVQASDEGEGSGEGSAEVGADFGRWGFFASGIIGRAEQDGTSRTPQYDYDTTGLTAGVDYRANESWVLGAALGYTQQDTELGDDGGDVDAKGWSVTGYSTWYHSTNWYLDGVLSYGSNDYDLRRSIVYQIVGAGGAITQIDQVASASTGGDQWMGSISGGRDFQKGAWSFGPYLRASYQRVEFDSYDEELQAGPGSGLGLSVESRALKSMTGVVGGKVSYAMSRDWGILLPYAQVEWEHEFKDDPQQVVTRFLYDPTGTIIRLNGQERDTDYFNIGVGLSAVFAGGRSGFVYYERVAGSEGLSQDSLSLGLRFEF